MPKYILTNKAVADLSSIWNYTFDNWSEKQADIYYNQILKKCSEISKYPKTGRAYSTLVESFRGAKINKHIIFYRQLLDETIEVVRILHESMDLKSRLLE